jgi:ribosomal protein S12 methylthiotransferase
MAHMGKEGRTCGNRQGRSGQVASYAVNRYWVETLGCPKNQVDSDKLVGTLLADGMTLASSADEADLVVVNTCAFIEAARQESIETVLNLADRRKDGAKIVVTGCMAERYGDELREALVEVDAVVGFGVSVNPGQHDHDHSDDHDHGNSHSHSHSDEHRLAGTPVSLSRKPSGEVKIPTFDLLNLPRPKSTAPWAYVKIAEGCDRNCGFCAIPSFRGPQRSRTIEQILDEVEQLDVQEIVLVAQDLASYGKDRPSELGAGSIVPLVRAVAERVKRTRLLYLYPSDLTDALIDAILSTSVPYFDLSLQHVSKPLLRRMRRWGDGDRFLKRIGDIRALAPDAAFRSNFIVGYPGETEDDHDQLLSFVRDADLDWCGFFEYSREDGTYAYDLDGAVAPSLMRERLHELTELQDGITARKRDALIGTTVEVLVDAVGVARSTREAPEIDGVIHVPNSLAVGTFAHVLIRSAEGPDCTAEHVPVDVRR